MEIEILQKKDEKKWEEFVLNSKNSTFCHLLGWREVIKKSYGHQDLYLVAKEGEEIKGILPSFIIKHFFFGKKIISLPFQGYGGIVADDEETEKATLEYLKDYTKKNNYDFFELRYLNSPFLNLPTNLLSATFILFLDRDENVIWKKLEKKVRNQIRKANKFGLELEISHSYLKDFYKLYQKNMKRLGTPVHSFSFFENLIEEFPNQIRTFMVKFKNKFIASLLLLSFKDIITNLWAASDYSFSQLNPNNFLYWETIKKVAGEGFKYFDFGRSKINSGPFNFKKHWGGEIRQLYYQYYSLKGKEVVLDRERYAKFSRLWRILPSGLINIIGPRIRKYIP